VLVAGEGGAARLPSTHLTSLLTLSELVYAYQVFYVRVHGGERLGDGTTTAFFGDPRNGDPVMTMAGTGSSFGRSSQAGRVQGRARGVAGAAVRELAEAFGAESPEDMNPFRCGARAAELVDAALAALGEAARWLAPYDSSGAHSAQGYRSTERFLALEAGCGPDLARTLGRVSRFCARHPLTGEHLASGAIGFDQVAVLARTVDSRLDGHYTEHETELLARAESARDVNAVSDLVRHWRNRVAPEVAAQDCNAAFEHRRLHLNRDLGGGVSGTFALDAVGGAIVANALDTQPDPATGPIEARTAAQPGCEEGRDPESRMTDSGEFRMNSATGCRGAPGNRR